MQLQKKNNIESNLMDFLCAKDNHAKHLIPSENFCGLPVMQPNF